jgi:protein-tyrosine phosphatase
VFVNHVFYKRVRYAQRGQLHEVVLGKQAAGVWQRGNHMGPRKKVREFKNLWLPFRDDMKARPRWFYRDALRFYKRAMRKPQTKVFVMCHHGLSRSPSLAYFLLRGASGFSHSRAQNAVLRVRPRAVIARAYREGGEIFLALEWVKKKYAKD